MKLHRLELEGFGPFLDRQVVDLDAFADDGIFLITGRTGAGKSSVLDGICYALYGGVPRYDGADRRLRSDHCGPDDLTQVCIEFSAEGRRWRVTRSPEFERPKRRGGGTTKEPHRASLEVSDGGEWIGVAARPVDVAARLDEILGLNQQQFLQVILLAQNRFARFLMAKNDERQTLLRTLFGTRLFEQYAAALDERRKRAQERLTAEGAEVSTLLDEAERVLLALAPEADIEAVSPDGAVPSGAATVAERLTAIVRGAERADYRVDTLANERDRAVGSLDAALVAQREATARHERQEERSRARAALAALEADDAHVAVVRIEAGAAAEAESVRAPLDARELARTALAAAERRRDDAAARAAAVGESVVDDDELIARADDLTALLARTDDARAAEGELLALDERVAMLGAQVAAGEHEVRALTERRAEVPAQLRALDERIAELGASAARLENAVAARDEVRHRLEAARDAARLLEEREKADLTALVRADDLQRAVDAWTTLLRRRLAGAATELAHDLDDGAACPVCGSLEHPHPAVGEDEPVTDAEITAAEDRKNAAAERDRLASDAARIARDAHTLASVRAGGAGVEALVERLAEAERDRAQAAEDADEHGRRVAERAELVARDADAARDAERLADELATARRDLALVDQRAAGLRAGVAEARGEFETVADRQGDLRARRDAVRALAAARTELAARVVAADECETALAAAVAESAFADPAGVVAALRDPAERRRLDARVADHDAAVKAARQRLLELELQLADVPDEPVDLVPFTEAVAAARESVQAATVAHATAEGAAAHLRDLAHRADAAHEAVARFADAHAVIARLADTLAGRAPNTRRMTLETFVLAAELEEIVEAANLRLEQMSSGRYRLQHTDALAARGAASGLGLEIMDAFTGQCRPPQSLSGGETFLASLALALGLAEVVTARAGGIRLDTLFIDEGFGSLDDETLDLALRTLDELRQGGRTVGVISHVASMKDQLPAQLRVTATPRGPSVIRQDAAALTT